MFFVKAQGRRREEAYDRGPINNELGREALKMAECRERLRTFEGWLGQRFQQAKALELSCLGFFVPACSRSNPERTAIKCCFCRCSLLYGPRITSSSSAGTGSGSGGGPGTQAQTQSPTIFETQARGRLEANVLPQSVLQPARPEASIQAAWLDSDPETRVVSVLRRHQRFSSTCPTTLGLACDNRKLTPEKIAFYNRTHLTSYNGPWIIRCKGRYFVRQVCSACQNDIKNKMSEYVFPI